ncbi:MAG TPA: GNAT family N-acetyltransferase [Bacillales bacterium]|nr:GNAT family N-acetyltransferase [Bacillales bacterium]
MSNLIRPTPWDEKAFDIRTFVLDEASEETLRQTCEPGHYTVKMDPLASKKAVVMHGFYYGDTLLKPVVSRSTFRPFKNDRCAVADMSNIAAAQQIAAAVYRHDRFHRDFNMSNSGADKRFANWLAQLHEEDTVWKLTHDESLAGFAGIQDDHIVLYGMRPSFQGRGFSKYFWSLICKKLFANGYGEVSTSISACNVAMVNLTASLGFRFREAVDVYHKYVPDRERGQQERT